MPLARDLWLATYLLLGLKLTQDFVGQLLQGVRQMRESSTYQAILQEGRNEGREEEARALLLRLGRERFGEADARTLKRVESARSIEELERLADRLVKADSWSELLSQ